MWLRKYAWPILAVVIFVLEMWAIFDNTPGNTISEWVADFPILLFVPVIIFLIWLPIHLWQERNQDD